MKKVLIIITFLLNIAIFGQGGFNNLTSHIKRNFNIEGVVLKGENNYGGSLMFGYYIKDYWAIRSGTTYRKFKYKSYTEDILEGDLGVVYTFYRPKYDTRFLSKLNVAAEVGGAFENVKVTSTTTLIDPYPKYIYVYGGLQLEYALNDHMGVVGHFRQFYAVNGSKDKLGNYRYDFGLGFRYYLWGKY